VPWYYAVVERHHELQNPTSPEKISELVHADAREFALEPERYDAALCLGASFVSDGLDGTLDALTPAIHAGGFVAVGEPYWRTWPLPEAFDPHPHGDVVPLAATFARFRAAGLEPVALIDASVDDWDR
jgi:hypothetical protein